MDKEKTSVKNLAIFVLGISFVLIVFAINVAFPVEKNRAMLVTIDTEHSCKDSTQGWVVWFPKLATSLEEERDSLQSVALDNAEQFVFYVSDEKNKFVISNSLRIVDKKLSQGDSTMFGMSFCAPLSKEEIMKILQNAF